MYTFTGKDPYHVVDWYADNTNWNSSYSNGTGIYDKYMATDSSYLQTNFAGAVVNYSTPSYDATIYNLGNGGYSVKTDSGVDVVTGADSLQFSDQSLSLENDIKATFDQVTGMDEVNGVIFRRYNAAFARLPDAGGLSNWINANSDGSFSYEQTANEFVNSQESINRYGSNQGDTDYITTVYNNVLDRDPDSAGLSHYESLLGSGEMSRAEMMFAFSESPENRILFTEVTGIS